MFRRYIRHRRCDGYESFTADKTCLLQCTVYVTLCWKTIRFINLKLRKLIDARARIYRESVRLMCFSHLMYIDFLSLTWYICEAETKILKHSKLQQVGQDSLKTVNAYKRETICPMTCARALAWKLSVDLLRQCNKRYSCLSSKNRINKLDDNGFTESVDEFAHPPLCNTRKIPDVEDHEIVTWDQAQFSFRFVNNI